MAQETTVTISESLEKEIQEFLERRSDGRTLPDVVDEAVRQYLALKTLESESVFKPVRRTLRITPAIPGSGLSDVSEKHDDYLADILPE